MRIRYELQTPWPTDVRNPDNLDAVDWSKYGEIPFVPFPGLAIDSGDGDLRVVKEVYWHAAAPDAVVVYMEDDVARRLEYWTAGCWETDDLPSPTMKPRRKSAVAP